ncbi:uncharacterized protein LOC124298159 [Neodiprion virginianus]|uniref:uncharacterized protein LOC124298159 n=1 Tax=Neodiprion virginianus TaxID=2961670 RepID=UPI001EE75489|nr:uncharacterized protein LOC124298159 [Neodiprion virginianus]
MAHWVRYLHLQQAVLMLFISNGCLLIGVKSGALKYVESRLNWEKQISDHGDRMRQFSPLVEPSPDRSLARQYLVPSKSQRQMEPHTQDSEKTSKKTHEPESRSLGTHSIFGRMSPHDFERYRLDQSQRSRAMTQRLSSLNRNEQNHFERQTDTPTEPPPEKIVPPLFPASVHPKPPFFVRRMPSDEFRDAIDRRQLFDPNNPGIIDNPGTRPPPESLKEWLKYPLSDEEYYQQVGLIPGGIFPAGSSR